MKHLFLVFGLLFSLAVSTATMAQDNRKEPVKKTCVKKANKDTKTSCCEAKKLVCADKTKVAKTTDCAGRTKSDCSKTQKVACTDKKKADCSKNVKTLCADKPKTACSEKGKLDKTTPCTTQKQK